MKQRPTSYLMNNDQRLAASRGGYLPANFNNNPSISRSTNAYEMLPEQKLRFHSYLLVNGRRERLVLSLEALLNIKHKQ